MPINVTDPAGQSHQFPDGTPDAAINSEMERRWGAQGTPQQPQPTPLTAPNKMPTGTVTTGTEPGSFSGKIGSDLETGMSPLSADAQRALRMLSMAGVTGNRTMEMAANQILAKDPTYQARKKESEVVGDIAGKRQGARMAGENILEPFAKLLHTFNSMPDEQLSGAIGPRNTAKLQETTPTFLPFTNIPIPGLSGPTTVDPRTKTAVAGQITPVQRNAILNPDDQKAAAAWNAQNLFGHDIHGITNALVTGAGSGVKMSDARQEMFNSAMEDFTKASSREEASRILDHAKTIIQNDFNLTPQEADQIINKHLQRYATDDQHKMLLTAAAKVPSTAYYELMANTGNKQYISSFNKHFNNDKPGLAEALIRSGSPMSGTQ